MLQFKTTLQNNITLYCIANGALSYFGLNRIVIFHLLQRGLIPIHLYCIISYLLPSDNGYYQCVDVNEYDRNYSKYATLTVASIS